MCRTQSLSLAFLAVIRPHAYFQQTSFQLRFTFICLALNVADLARYT